MYKRFLIVLWLFAFCRLQGQDIVQYADTFKLAEHVSLLSDDRLLLDLLAEQSARIAARDDSLMRLRLLTDTTTAFPFHIGFGDSLRIAQTARAIAATYPLTLPLIYMPEEPLSFTQKRDTAVTVYTIRNAARRYIATHEAGLFRGVRDTAVLNELVETKQTLSQYLRPSVPALIPDAEEDRQEALRLLHRKPSHWRKEGTVMLQLTQSYVSSNWYQGGNSNFAALAILQGKIVYRDHKRITWENTGEWRAGFNTVTGDSLRKVNTNDDVFHLYSKFGLKVVEKLNYSISADLQTSFFNTWKENTKELKTGPLTPMRINIATGLDYKPVRGLSIYVAPLAYRFVGALDTVHTEPTDYSIPSGSRILNDLGSSLRVVWQWKPVREIELETNFYLYTNYRKVELDWETVCNFIINRYLSGRIMLHPRYDDTVILSDGERPKMQFKELISIGFAHKFR